MRKVEDKTAELVDSAAIELLRPDKDRVLTIRQWLRHWSATILFCSSVLLLATWTEEGTAMG